MFPTALLIASLLLTVSVAANHIVVRDAPVSLSLTRRLNITNSLDLIRRDRARMKHLVALGKAEKSGASTQETTASITVTNGAIDYVASVGVGSPPTYCGSHCFNYGMDSYTYFVDTLIVDTGSSNTWIGAEKHYVKTKTSVQTRDSVVSVLSLSNLWAKLYRSCQSVSYGTGLFFGKFPRFTAICDIYTLSQVPST
jgi:cathepsin E